MSIKPSAFGLMDATSKASVCAGAGAGAAVTSRWDKLTEIRIARQAALIPAFITIPLKEPLLWFAGLAAALCSTSTRSAATAPTASTTTGSAGGSGRLNGPCHKLGATRLSSAAAVRGMHDVLLALMDVSHRNARRGTSGHIRLPDVRASFLVVGVENRLTSGSFRRKQEILRYQKVRLGCRSCRWNVGQAGGLELGPDIGRCVAIGNLPGDRAQVHVVRRNAAIRWLEQTQIVWKLRKTSTALCIVILIRVGGTRIRIRIQTNDGRTGIRTHINKSCLRIGRAGLPVRTATVTRHLDRSSLPGLNLYRRCVDWSDLVAFERLKGSLSQGWSEVD